MKKITIYKPTAQLRRGQMIGLHDDGYWYHNIAAVLGNRGITVKRFQKRWDENIENLAVGHEL